MWFTRISLSNPVMATMAMLALFVLGILSYQKLKVDQFPSIEFPVVVVTTEYPGASPEIIETEISKRLEESLSTLSGLNAITSRSYNGLSVVIVEFSLNADVRTVAEDVREKVAQVSAQFVSQVRNPKVQRFDPASNPIWLMAITPNKQTREENTSTVNQWVEDTVKTRLQNVSGVGNVEIIGNSPRKIYINLNPKALQAHNISADQVANSIGAQYQNIPLGNIRSENKDITVQTAVEIQNPEQFGELIIAKRGGAPVYLKQIAQISTRKIEYESQALLNDTRTILVSVQKSQDANTVELVDALNANLQILAKEAPPDTQLQTVFDGSRTIRVAVQNVKSTLLDGAYLTILIVFLFLNSWRSTVITGLTLPISIFGTFLFMHALGFTINLITLMALSLCIGLLIDDAIVVRENIVRHLYLGKNKFQAALEGTQEIGLAVFATTMSIVAVFLPIGFMEGILGKFFHQFGLTVVIAVLLSMFVSFTLDPMLSSIWHEPLTTSHSKQKLSFYDRSFGLVTTFFHKLMLAFTRRYSLILDWSLCHRFITLMSTLCIFVLSLYLMSFLGTEFVPKADYSEFRVNFFTPAGSSIRVTESKVIQLTEIIKKHPETQYIVSTINTGNLRGKIYASMYVKLIEKSKRTKPLENIVQDLRNELKQVAGITITHIGQLDAVGGNKQIEFSIQGPDIDKLQQISSDLSGKLSAIPGLVDLDSSFKPNNPTVNIEIGNEILSDLNISFAGLTNHLRTLIGGTEIGNWNSPNNLTYKLILQLPENNIQNSEQLKNLPVILPNDIQGNPQTTSLSQIANIKDGFSPNQINRRNLAREVLFSANTSGRPQGQVSADIDKILKSANLPAGYHYEFIGSVKNMKESIQYAIISLMLAILFIYMILASQFVSFLQPITIMTSLPLTLIGVVLTLLFFQSTLSIFSMIGIILLMGLVTKNAILLIDFVIRLNKENALNEHQTKPSYKNLRRDNIIQAAKVRLRPILMTSLAMIFGMVPLAFSLTEGAEQRAPMGQAVIGGVLTSSILTLVVVPVVYTCFDDIKLWLQNLIQAKRT